MTDSYLDPRNIAYELERAAFGAELRAENWSEATVTISAEVAYKIAEHLRRAPLKRGGARNSLYELGHRNALVEKARRYKAELIAGGKSATEAEDEAAEHFATVMWSAGTIRRQMQRKTNSDAE